MRLDLWEDLKVLSVKKRKPVGQILEELVSQYGEKVKAYKHPHEGQ